MTLVCISSTSVDTHRSAADSTLMAQRPMARTDLRTKSTSTSVEYLVKKEKICMSEMEGRERKRGRKGGLCLV